MKESKLGAGQKGNIIKIIIYVILVASAFSDIFRISGTSVTVFRLFIPLAVLILTLYPYWCVKFCELILGISILTIVQYIVFYKIIYSELQFVPTRIFTYFFLYFCIILVFCLVKIIQINSSDFEKSFSKFIIIVGCGLMVVNLFYDFCPSFFGNLQADNQNNYGCYIAAVIPFLLVKLQMEKRGREFFCVVLGIVLLLINDSKAALFGVAIQFVLFLGIAFEAKTKRQLFYYRGGIIIIGIIGTIFLLIINPSLHGYTLRGLVFEPIQRIVTNTPYSYYTTSITYRTNTTIYAIWTFIITAGFGLGIGNTGIALKSAFPELNPEYIQALSAEGLSLHNSWLEALLDVGIIMLIIYFFIIKYVLKIYFKKRSLTQLEKIRVLYIASFPIWIISTSGMYTLYYLMIIMAFLLFADNKHELYGRI